MSVGSAHRGELSRDERAVTSAADMISATPDESLGDPRASRMDRPMRWAGRRGLRLIMLADVAALYSSMFVINVLRFGWTWPDFSKSHYMAGFAMATAIQIGTNYFLGLYQREPRIGRRPWLSRVAFAMIVGVFAMWFAVFPVGRYLLPRLNLLVLALVGTVLLTVNRHLSRVLAQRRFGAIRVLLVGDELDCDLATQHIEPAATNVEIVGRTVDTSHLIRDVGVTEASDVLLLGRASYSEIFPDPLTDLERFGVGVFQRVTAAQTLLGLHELREIGGMPFVELRSRGLPSHKIRAKRALDLVIVGIGAPLIVLIVAITALYVRIRAGRPVLYRQVRVGRGGEPFTMVKFRTMEHDAESTGAQLSSAGDARVVRGLGWLRGTRLDETPQLFHVLTGKMSIVGPRPERPEFTRALAAEVPGYERRFELPPGLTGLAQINGRYSTDAAYKIGYDLQYVADWTLLGDLQIIGRTIWVVLSRRV